MFQNLTEASFAEGAAALQRLLYGGGGIFAKVMSPLGKFVYDRFDFFVHHPAVTLSGLLVNAFIVWWLVRSPKVTTTRFSQSARSYDLHRAAHVAGRPLQAMMTKEAA